MTKNNIIKPRLLEGDFFKKYRKTQYRSVDLFLSDIPYGLFTYDNNITGVKDPKLNIGMLEDCLKYIMNRKGTVILFCNLSLLIRLKQTFKEYDFRYEYVIYKNNGSPVHKTRPLNNVEYMGVFKHISAKAKDLVFNPYESGNKGTPYIKKNYNLNHTTRKNKKRILDTNHNGKRYIKQSLEMKSKCNLPKDERTGHPFQKSERLLRTLIKVHSKPNDLVCDGFCGSGSTLVSAYKENRRSIGFEIDKKWYDVSNKRISQETNKVKIFN